MIKKRILVLTAVLLTLSPLSLWAFVVNATPAIGSTTVTLYAVADAYVNSSIPLSNYGSAASMYVSANSEQDFTYVKFDLAMIPSGSNVISAKLKIYLSDTDGSIYAIPADTIGAYYCSDNSWSELGITWNNKPSFNQNPTGSWSFGIVDITGYKSWDATADVKTALTSGTLTEVLKFTRKMGDGAAVFQSREGANRPKLEVEYSTEPVAAVHLESIQDTGVINNLGLTTFADYTFSLPTDIDVVPGSYPIRYSGGYMFMSWETSGGVSVSNANSASTTVTVSGSGTLRAVGNEEQLEYTYDYEHAGSESQKAGCIDAVRFTALFSGQLLMARFYIYDISSYSSNTFKLHVMDANRHDIITPFQRTPTSMGWLDVDLSSYGISVNFGTDFYIGMEWMTDYHPNLAEDTTSNFDRSWYWNGTNWQQETYGDFIIRAVVRTIGDHAILADGTVFHIITESNSTLSNFQFIKENKKVLFNVTGTTGTSGFCNITIQNQLLGGPFTVTLDGQPLSEVLSFDNGINTWLYFTYLQSAHRIEIVGGTVIPEFPSAIMLSIFMSIAAVAVALRRRMRH